METTSIENIQVLDKLKLCSQFMHNCNIIASEAMTTVKILLESNKYTFKDIDVHWLKNSPYISFDVIEKQKEDYNGSSRSQLNDDNNIENKLGLTESEKWFNSLSEEEKTYVKNLSSFFNPPAYAG
jgi:hypothetical protein